MQLSADSASGSGGRCAHFLSDILTEQNRSLIHVLTSCRAVSQLQGMSDSDLMCSACLETAEALHASVVDGDQSTASVEKGHRVAGKVSQHIEWHLLSYFIRDYDVSLRKAV